jgi:osmotically-inducible protein OsmY
MARPGLRSDSARTTIQGRGDTHHERSLVLTDNSLEDAVISSLELDPRIPDANDIAVTADEDIVVLRGSVQTFGQRRAAAEDARKVDGVDDVDDQLKVDLLDGDRREDDEIRGVALQALIWDTEVPADFVDVKVQHGWITLKGDVMYQYQSDAAYDDVATLYGVYGVTNEIKVNRV